jgi:hypothetical protein
MAWLMLRAVACCTRAYVYYEAFSPGSRLHLPRPARSLLSSRRRSGVRADTRFPHASNVSRLPLFGWLARAGTGTSRRHKHAQIRTCSERTYAEGIRTRLARQLSLILQDGVRAGSRHTSTRCVGSFVFPSSFGWRPCGAGGSCCRRRA